MIIFPQNPIWFALKFINIMRNHEKCPYKPSVRQALAMCKLMISRFLNRGECHEEDFIEIAVVTSPMENQKLAKKISKELLTFNTIKKPSVFQIGEGEVGFFNDIKPKDLINEFDHSFDDIDTILDDFTFLENNIESDNINEIDWEQEYYSHFDEFFQQYFEELQKEPYKTALKIVEDNSISDFNKFRTLKDLLNYAKEILREKINTLEPEDINSAKNIEFLDPIIKDSDKFRERITAKLAKDSNLEQFQDKIKTFFQNDFFQALDCLNFVLQSKILDEEGRKLVKKLFEEFLEEMNASVDDLYEATKVFGENLDLKKELVDQIIKNSLDLPFQEAYKNIKEIDRYFGGNLLDKYLDQVHKKIEQFESPEKIRDALVTDPTRTSSWRELLSESLNKEMENIEEQNKGHENIHQYLKDFTDEIIDKSQNTGDPMVKAQFRRDIEQGIEKTLKATNNKEELTQFVEDLRIKGFSPSEEIIREVGENLNMNERELLRLIASDYEDLKDLIQENLTNYTSYKTLSTKLNLSNWQVNELTSLALNAHPPNTAALGALSEINLSRVLQTATEMGEEQTELAFSSLGAGEGLDLLQQWFFSRDQIPYKVKGRLKQFIKQIMIDLGIKSANTLIGSSNSGPLVENTVIPYQTGDDFELIDLEITIANILESGKSLQTISEDDFLVSKTSQGLRSIVLELDISGSMHGEKLAQMALSTTMLVYAFQPEELAISFFESNTYKLKGLDDKVPLDGLVDELLDIKAGGGTCIRAALNWANHQFKKKAKSKSKLNILFTDADIFDFHESKSELNKMKSNNVKFVMVVPKFNYAPIMAKRMVKLANGVLLTLDQWRNFPKLISEIIKEK